jgi:hypothetical protein
MPLLTPTELLDKIHLLDQSQRLEEGLVQYLDPQEPAEVEVVLVLQIKPLVQAPPVKEITVL